MGKKLFFIVAAVFIGVAVIYVKSIYDHMQYTAAFLSGEPAVDPNVAEAKPFELENKLESTKVVKDTDGRYRVETYREYEVYKDADGKEIKSVPTGNFSYLRYRVK